MWDSIKGILRTVAPVIGSAIGGPLGGIATTTLSQVLLGKDDVSSEEIEKALNGMTPDMMFELRQKDIAFKVEMSRIEKEIRDADHADRKDAREMAKEESKLGKIDFMRPVMGVSIVVGCIALTCALLFVKVPVDVKDILVMMIGCFTGCLLTVFQFYFGSSSGSNKKTDLMNKRDETEGLIEKLIGAYKG